jgi:hypothetical protein
MFSVSNDLPLPQEDKLVDKRSIMKPRLNYASLETMCRLQAAAAKREMEYWLAEAEEWRKLKGSQQVVDSIPTQLDWCAESEPY